MELRIKPFPKNKYPRKGLLVKGASPLVWLREIDALAIDISAVKSFAVPSNEPNVLYGCFLIFNQNIPAEIGKNAYFQCFDDMLFIPENTDFYPKINAEDWQNTEAEYLIIHPEFGLVKLKEPIDWVSLLQESPKAEDLVRKPLNGVHIPQEIKTFLVEMNDDRLLEELEKPQTDEEWMKNLPFDKKKLLEGNQEEIEKYLAYITRYPERAIYLGIPLDIGGTFRGDGFGNFNFDPGWFAGLFGNAHPEGDHSQPESNNSQKRKSKDYHKILVAVLLLVIVVGFAVGSDHKNRIKSESADLYSDSAVETAPTGDEKMATLAFESGFTETDMKIDSLYRKERARLMAAYDAAIAENSSGEIPSSLNWEIEGYRVREKQSRDSLKVIYNEKIAEYVDEKTKFYKEKVADSLRKYITISSASRKLLMDETVEKRRMAITDSLMNIYGTANTIDPVVVYKNNSFKKMFKVNENSSGESGASFPGLILLLLSIGGAVAFYIYFVKDKPLDIGGSHMPQGIKILLMTLLAGMILYIFYPLISMFGYNWLVWILVVVIAVVLYRLFSEDETILKSGKNE